MLQLNFSPFYASPLTVQALFAAGLCLCRWQARRRLLTEIGRGATRKQHFITLYSYRLQFPGLAGGVGVTHELFVLISEMGNAEGSSQLLCQNKQQLCRHPAAPAISAPQVGRGWKAACRNASLLSCLASDLPPTQQRPPHPPLVERFSTSVFPGTGGELNRSELCESLGLTVPSSLGRGDAEGWTRSV